MLTDFFILIFFHFQLVEEEGGMDQINRERRWSRIATRMHYPSKQVGTTLRAHYEKILYPFYVFKKGDIFDSEVSTKHFMSNITTIFTHKRSLNTVSQNGTLLFEVIFIV